MHMGMPHIMVAGMAAMIISPERAGAEIVMPAV